MPSYRRLLVPFTLNSSSARDLQLFLIANGVLLSRRMMLCCRFRHRAEAKVRELLDVAQAMFSTETGPMEYR